MSRTSEWRSAFVTARCWDSLADGDAVPEGTCLLRGPYACEDARAEDPRPAPPAIGQ